MPHDSDQESEPEIMDYNIDNNDMDNAIRNDELDIDNEKNGTQDEANKADINAELNDEDEKTKDGEKKGNEEAGNNDDDDEEELDDSFCLSIIYNVDTSPAFQYLDDLNKNKGIDDEK